MSGGRPRWDRIRPAIESPTGWSLRLGLLGGVEVRMHALVAAWIGLVLVRLGAGPLVGGPARDPLTEILESVAILVAAGLFESARLAAARRLGVLPLTETLWPLGGLEDLPPRADWRTRVWVAIAGPAVLLIAATITGLVLARVTGTVRGIAIPPLFGEPAAGTLVTLDRQQPFWLVALFGLQRGFIVVLLLHLVPAAPMSGGRLVEAAIGARVGRRRAIASAASVAFVAGGVLLLAATGLGRGLGVLVGLTTVVGAAGVLTAAPDRRGGDPLLPAGLAGIDPDDADPMISAAADEPRGRGFRQGLGVDDEALLAGLTGLADPAEARGRGAGRGPETAAPRDPVDPVELDETEDEVVITPLVDVPLEDGGTSGDPPRAPRRSSDPGDARGRTGRETGEAEEPDEAGLDRVLAKIAGEGLDSLTDRERAVLAAATARRLESDP